MPPYDNRGEARRLLDSLPPDKVLSMGILIKVFSSMLVAAARLPDYQGLDILTEQLMNASDRLLPLVELNEAEVTPEADQGRMAQSLHKYLTAN